MDLSSQEKQHLEQYRKNLNFDSTQWITDKCTSLNNYMLKNNLFGCVVGLSGGIDSAVTFMLAVRASSMPLSPIKIIVPVLLPYNTSEPPSVKRAIQQCQVVNIQPFYNPIADVVSNISQSVNTNMIDWFQNQTGQKNQTQPSVFAYGQLQSYTRTPILYYVTQLLSDRNVPSIVLGTGNKDEDHYLGYFCKAGDGVVDLQLINDLHKNQVFQVGKTIGVVDDILNAPPSAELWEGQTDEGEMGFSYDFVEFYTGVYLKMNDEEINTFINSMSPEDVEKFKNKMQRCESIHNKNAHKLKGVINL